MEKPKVDYTLIGLPSYTIEECITDERVARPMRMATDFINKFNKIRDEYMNLDKNVKEIVDRRLNIIAEIE